jgi:ABC-type Na+ efflux pump permease subunit
MIQAMFYFEMLHAGRRRRGFFLRWIYAAFLLVQIAPLFFLSKLAWARLLSGLNVHAFFESLLTQHYVLLTLLTPAMVGGTLTEEKTRGTLQHLLTTRLRAGEIILGKILAHTYQLALLSLVGLPLFCLFGGLAGDASFAPAVIVSSLALVFGIAGLSILFSVWCRTTRDALLCVYLLIAIAAWLIPFLAGTSWGSGLPSLHPLHVFSLDDVPARWRRLGEFLLGWVLVGLVCVLAASWRLRRTYRRQLQIQQRPAARWWRASHGRVRGNPVLWREQKVEGIAPLQSMRRQPRWLGVAAVLAASAGTLGGLLVVFLSAVPAVPGGAPVTARLWAMICAGAWAEVCAAFAPVAAEAFFWHGLAALLLLTLVVAIRASGSISGEKEKGTWEALLLTPLTTQKIIAGKHRGIFWASVPYVAAHGAVTLPLALVLDLGAATWAVLWLVVMVLAIILGGALGLWCSARAASSWRGLVSTLALFYLGWLLFFLPVTFLLVIFKGAIELGLRFIGLFTDTSVLVAQIGSSSVSSWALCLAMAAAFWCLTHRLLAAAVARVGRNDREGGFDYYYLYRDYFRRKQEEKWESPRIETDVTAIAHTEKEPTRGPIP